MAILALRLLLAEPVRTHESLSLSSEGAPDDTKIFPERLFCFLNILFSVKSMLAFTNQLLLNKDAILDIRDFTAP